MMQLASDVPRLSGMLMRNLDEGRANGRRGCQTAASFSGRSQIPKHLLPSKTAENAAEAPFWPSSPARVH